MSEDSEDKLPKLSFKTTMHDIWLTTKLNWQLDKGQVGIFSVGAILEITGTLVSTYAAARLISLLFQAVSNPALRSQVWLWLALSIGGTLAINLGFQLMRYSKRVLYLLVSKWSSMDFMRQLSTIDIQSFHDTNLRNNINKLDSGHGWQMSVVTNYTLDLVYGTIRCLVIVFVIARLAWWLLPFLVIFTIPSLISETKVNRAGWFVWDEKGDERHVYWGTLYLIARAKGQFEIRAMQAKDKLLDLIDGMVSKFQNKQLRVLRNANFSITVSKLIETLGIALTEIWLVWRLLYQHTLSVSSYIFYSSMVARVNGALNTAVGSYIGMQESLLYAHDFFEFSQLKPQIVSGDVKLARNKIPEIIFKNVWFKYPHAEKWVFEDLNFTIKPGEHLALIGENGAGKTTIVKLLLRFYDVTEGSIEINGHDIKTLSLDEWYAQLGTLFQQFNEYPFDVGQNIMMGSQSKQDDKQLEKALKNSGMKEIVEKLPYGLETVLDSSFKKGTEPSGGQWQRVALARAFYRDPNVLILDEPTSAIDARAEYDIFNNIFKNRSGKSAIIISHRFSTVRRADRIIVLENGKIVEEGGHSELMTHKDGVYKELFEKQAEGYR